MSDKKIIKALTFLLVIFSIFLAAIYNNPVVNPRWVANQKKLADTLDVRMRDYPPVYSFPGGYFDSVLDSESTIKNVHEVIIGYEHVKYCLMEESDIMLGYEIYQYFGSEDNNSYRFAIFYDIEGKFIKRIGGDPNSSPVGYGCESGLLSY